MSLSPLAAHFVCPINQDLMDEPVTIKCQGRHAFNRDGITEWFKSHNTCPVCKQQVASKKLTPARLLKQIIDTWKQANAPASLAGRTEPAGSFRVDPPKPVKKEEAKEAPRYSYDSRSSSRDYSSRVSSYRPAPPQQRPAPVRNYYVHPVCTPAVHIYISCHGCMQSQQPSPYQPAIDRMNSTMSRIELEVARIKSLLDRYVADGRRY